MLRRFVFCIVMAIGFSLQAQTINLSGTVSSSTGKPIANAIVTLAGQAMKDTTGSTGAYTLKRSVGVELSAVVPQTQEISLNNGVLQLGLTQPSPVKVEIFSVQGDLLVKESKQNAPAGIYRLNIEKRCRAEKVLVVRASIGRNDLTFRYLPLHNAAYTLNSSVEKRVPVNAGLAKLAVVDTLKTTAAGYVTKAVAITSYDTTVNIALDTLVAGSTGSIGCGKDLSTLKSGTYTITSAGLSRQYIIDIPTGYDKNHPYRLIFGMHCYGSSMQGVASDKYYQLKRFADSTKTPCIFVAPNGYGTGTPLWNQNEKDHTFVDDMLKLFKEQLCVDTTRVFSCGFSYGAMFSYSLSTNHQKQLRAVACYAPANWNIWLPTNTHEPIAYMSTTGMSDPNCPLVYNDANQQGGKYCSLGHATDNGCTIPATLPTTTAGSKTHLCYDFQGCKDGYPVKFCTFDGGHQAGPMDGVSGDNSSKSWIPGETWKFFMQF